MSNFNQVVLVGNLVSDPELVYLPSGTPVVNCTIAVNRPGFKGGKDEVLFMPFAVFGKSADALVKYSSKGSSLLIAGRLIQDKFEGKSGPVTITKVVVDRFQFLGKTNKDDVEFAPEKQIDKSTTPGVDDIPF